MGFHQLITNKQTKNCQNERLWKNLHNQGVSIVKDLLLFASYLYAGDSNLCECFKLKLRRSRVELLGFVTRRTCFESLTTHDLSNTECVQLVLQNSQQFKLIVLFYIVQC